MKLAQLLLLFVIGGSLVLYLRHFRSSFWDRMGGMIGFSLLGVSVLFPSITQVAAKLLGVGRGADLVFYLFGVCTLFVLVLFYVRFQALERQQTILIRLLALQGARWPAREAHQREVRQSEDLRSSLVPGKVHLG